MRVAKEILLVEDLNGDFAPAPTRAQKRQAKRAEEARRKQREDRWEMVAGVLLMTFVVSGSAAIVGAWLFAEKIWPLAK